MTKTRNILILSLFLLTTCLSLPVIAQDKAIGTVTRIQATPTMNGKQVSRGDLVYPHSSLTTKKDDRLEITFNDSTLLVIGADTHFIIDEYTYNGDASVKKALFKLSKGAFRTITSAIIDTAPENFSVVTPLAVIGIRGTDFWGGYLSEQEFDVVMLEGKGVIVTSMGGSVVIDEPGVGVSVPDPTKHPGGYSKALLPPVRTKWQPEKLALATATVMFE